MFSSSSDPRRETQLLPPDDPATVQHDEDEAAYRYELYWRAVIEKDLHAQHELAELRQQDDEAVAELDQQRYEAQQAYDAFRASDALRRCPDATSTVLRPIGRSRRPGCSQRTRGSRRTSASSRAGPSSDKPPGDDEPPGGRHQHHLDHQHRPAGGR